MTNDFVDKGIRRVTFVERCVSDFSSAIRFGRNVMADQWKNRRQDSCYPCHDQTTAKMVNNDTNQHIIQLFISLTFNLFFCY